MALKCLFLCPRKVKTQDCESWVFCFQVQMIEIRTRRKTYMSQNSTTKPNISIEGKMNAKDAGRVAVIMAYGKAISLILGSLAGLIVAVVGLIKLIMGM